MTAKTKTIPNADLPKKRRARLDVDERRAQLIALGLSVFATQPYESVSVDELAQRAGISKGLLYHYFPTKHDFYVAALDHAARMLTDETITPADRPSNERLRLGFERYFEFVERHGPAFIALLRGGIGSDPDVAAILERTRGIFVTRILETVPREFVTPLLRAGLRGWIGFVEAAAVEWVMKRNVPKRKLIDLLSTMLFATVTAATGFQLD